MGDFFEVRGVGLAVGGLQGGDTGCGVLDEAHRRILVHDRQGALDLLQGRARRRGCRSGSARGKAVETLLDFGQTVEDFVGELAGPGVPGRRPR